MRKLAGYRIEGNGEGNKDLLIVRENVIVLYLAVCSAYYKLDKLSQYSASSYVYKK